VNLVLLFAEDFQGGSLRHARLTGRRLQHLIKVIRARAGDELTVGLVGGPVGRGLVMEINHEVAVLDVLLEGDPPAPLPLILVVALPRPKVLNRLVAAVTSLGVKHLIFINAWKVEKSYWSSPRLAEANLRQQAIIGLEQGRDTILPLIETRRFFRRFVEDELTDLSSGTLRLVAHPGGRKECPREVGRKVTLIIGPEGGFIADEIALLERYDFLPIHLGSRILRVETAVAAVVGRLF
jgi:RsmE family RNA methyltransferase